MMFLRGTDRPPLPAATGASLLHPGRWLPHMGQHHPRALASALARWQPGAVAGTAGGHCRLASLFLQLSTFSEPLLNCATRANQVEAPPSPGTREVEAGITHPGGQGNINFIDRHMYVHVCYSTRHACGSDQTPMIQGIEKSTVRRHHGPAGAAPTPSGSGWQELMPRARAT